MEWQAAAVDVAERDQNTLALQILEHFGGEIVARSGRVEGGAIAVLAAHFHSVDRDLANVVLIHITHKLSDIHFFIFLAVAGPLDHFPQQQGGYPDQQPEQHGLYG